MMENFLNSSTLITYTPEKTEQESLLSLDDFSFADRQGELLWFNTYGINYQSAFAALVKNNHLDSFLLTLLKEQDHTNKVIELDDLLFITLKVLKQDSNTIDSEQMFFIVLPHVVWSLQEETGSYFQWIRDRQKTSKTGSNRSVSYLLFLLIKSLIDNYESVFEKMTDNSSDLVQFSDIDPSPAFTARVETQKRSLLNFKKVALSLRNTLVKLEKVEAVEIETKYFTEAKEQAANLINDIDFELQELDSKINLIFAIQGHRLNEVMRILTVISVLFIPLTFFAGLYGMNFAYIPELKWRYGYFILLALMAVMTITIIVYFKKRKWF